MPLVTYTSVDITDDDEGDVDEDRLARTTCPGRLIIQSIPNGGR